MMDTWVRLQYDRRIWEGHRSSRIFNAILSLFLSALRNCAHLYLPHFVVLSLSCNRSVRLALLIQSSGPFGLPLRKSEWRLNPPMSLNSFPQWYSLIIPFSSITVLGASKLQKAHSFCHYFIILEEIEGWSRPKILKKALSRKGKNKKIPEGYWLEQQICC